MKLDEAWREEFASGDLSRGEGCYCDGAVHALVASEGGWKAKVFGTEVYSTFVPEGTMDPDRMTCDCPRFANGYLCKHLAATCFAIERGEAQEGQPQDDVQDLVSLVATVPEADVRAFLVEALSHDDKLATLFAHRFGSVSSQAACAHMSEQIEEAVWDYADRGFIDWHGAMGFERRYGQIVHLNIDPLVERGEYEPALALSFQALRSLQRISIDDSDGFFSSAIDDVEDMWEVWLRSDDKIAGLLFERISDFLLAPPADDEEREIYSYAADMARDFQLEHYVDRPEYAERFVALADGEMASAQEELDDVLRELESVRAALEDNNVPRGRGRARYASNRLELERKERSLTYRQDSLNRHMDRWALIRLRALRSAGMDEDGLRTAAGTRIVHEPLCEFFVNMALERSDTDEAIRLLRACKEYQATQSGGTYSTRVSERLASLFEGRDDEAMRQELLYLIEQPSRAGAQQGPRSLWQRLRTSYDAATWESRRDELLGGIGNPRSRRDCLAEEGLFERLMDEVEREGLSATWPYEAELTRNCPDRMLKLYLDDVTSNRQYPGSSRKSYRAFAQRLLCIKGIPGGEAPVDAIVREMRTRYSNRPALLDELSVL